MTSVEEISDLIDHFELEATYFPTFTIQICYESIPDQGLRKVKTQKRWQRGKIIGEGGFGSVWLEEYRKNDIIVQRRAIKEVRKRDMTRAGVNYRREVLALARLSKVIVPDF